MQQSSQYQLKLINQTIRNDVTYYSIQVNINFIYFKVVNTSQKLSWSFEERYKNMLTLHEQIKGLSKTVPAFPPKKMFGNTDPEFISQRKAGLQNYFKNLLQLVDVDSIKPLKDFLTRGEAKQIRESQAIQSQNDPGLQQQKDQANNNQIIQPHHQKQNIKTQYEKISNETNGKFIDIGNMINAPEENDIERKKQLYEQVKIDLKVFNSIQIIYLQIDNYKQQMQSNPDAYIIMAKPTLQFQQPGFFKLLENLQHEVNIILE